MQQETGSQLHVPLLRKLGAKFSFLGVGFDSG
jgi:hypothetical protein